MNHSDFEPNTLPASSARLVDTTRVLVADHDADRRLRYSATLEGAGYAVIQVGDLTQAIEHAGAAPTAIIIAYLTDPKTDGADLCRRVRKDPHTRAIPFVVVTSYGDPFTREQIVRAGASGILVEPFNRALLVRHVRRQIARAKAHAPQRQ